MIKTSSGRQTTSGLIFSGPCIYYGFTCLPGALNRTVQIYDNIVAAGNLVEDFIADGNKPTDGHSHANPVHCANGLYLSLGGGSAVIYYRSDFSTPNLPVGNFHMSMSV